VTLDAIVCERKFRFHFVLNLWLSSEAFVTTHDFTVSCSAFVRANP